MSNPLKRKAIILSGGKGTRLYPITKVVSKQLQPVYDSPMIYYPLYTVAKAGMKDILIISTPEALPLYKMLLGDGSQWNLRISYKVQETANGLAQAFVLGEEFIGNSPVCLILGDNVFWGSQFEKAAREANKSVDNTVFSYTVKNPSDYGVAEFDENDNVISIEEKPMKPKSNQAVVGLYFYNNDVISVAKSLKPSKRGEYEITDVNKEYLKRGELKLKKIEAGNLWADCGSIQSLNDTSNFVRTIQERTGIKVANLESL